MSVFHAVYATTVFVVAYVLIATERFNQTLVALGGATAMFFLPVIDSDEVFYSRGTGVNWDVIFLLLGMMIIVSVVRQTGLFEYMAIWSAKRAKGSPLRIMILLILVTALGTAILDNVTTVLLIAPVTLLVCDRLEISPAPFLIAEALAANIAGAATLVGDPTSIIIGTGAQLSFITFTANMAPAVLIVLAVLLILLPRLFPGFFTVDPARAAEVLSLNEREAIRNPRLLIQCGIVLVAVFAGFVAHKEIHTEPSLVALAGAGILVAMSGLSREFYLSSVEWESLLFFAGLFIMVGALVRTGVVKAIGRSGQPPNPRRCLDGNDVDPHCVLHFGQLYQQCSVCRHDDTGRRTDGRIHPRTHQFRCAVVGPAVGHRPWRQPHRRGSQREYRRGRDRATRRPSRLLLGLH